MHTVNTSVGRMRYYCSATFLRNDTTTAKQLNQCVMLRLFDCAIEPMDFKV